MKKIIICGILSVWFLLSSTMNAQKMNCWRWERLKPGDLETALKTVPVAYLVVSPLEWHGDALAFGTDPAIGTEIAEIAWRSTGGVLIPTLYIGSETEYKDWTSEGLTSYWGMEWVTKEHNPGSLYISNNTFELVVRDMLYSIERQGFKACVIVSGHGATEYVRILQEYEKRSADRPMKVIYSNLVVKDRPEELDFPGSGGHADFAEVSVLGAVDSSMIDLSLFGKSQRDQKIGLYEKNIPFIDYEKGRASIDFRAERIIETINQFMAAQNPE
jgi:creatinine amidohydrolase/Fe(II)-dependent formamide hydrolase-like protein